MTDFTQFFETTTGNTPFPWQIALYNKFSDGEFPSSANIPTGLGKTSIVAIWLISLALHPNRVPRRLVYVVNRRTVVDQTTDEVVRLRNALAKPELAEIRSKLMLLCALPLPTLEAQPLAISTLRGQFADNGEWCADPSRPAVVVGTVDMIGSGLLFSRYTRGFRTRPLQAGFLTQDALLVHDEAHLEPAFQTLLESIVTIQKTDNDPRKLHVLELTATSRSSNNASSFTLEEADKLNEVVKQRIHAFKKLSLIPACKIESGKDKANDSTVRDKIIEVALSLKDSGRAILIFVRSVKSAVQISSELSKKKCLIATLTGTMRGKERDELVTNDAVFQRFLPKKNLPANPPSVTDTVFLVATSAGEVGINISADDLLCDLSTYESMAQRFGRVNRFGERNDSEITVLYRENMQVNYDDGLQKAKSAKKDPEKKAEAYQRKNQAVLSIIRTLNLLKELKGNASPVELDKLPVNERTNAFSPSPEIRVATEIQFDAWALTSIRTPIAARPPVAPYLHGESEWQPPETHVAWRKELDVLNTDELRNAYQPADLLEDFPLKPHELLRDTSERVYDCLVRILKNNTTHSQAWLVQENGNIEILSLLDLISDQEIETDNNVDEDEETGETPNETKRQETTRKNRFVARFANTTLILPESLGCIDKGLLSHSTIDKNADVADIPNQRTRVLCDTPDIPDNLSTSGFRLVRLIDSYIGKGENDGSESGEDDNRYWLWLEAKSNIRSNRTAGETLADHTNAVVSNAAAIAAKIFPDTSRPSSEPDLHRCIVIAAHLHDLGKNRAQWQRNIGNRTYDPTKPETILAKSAYGMRSRNVVEHYRHEFGSLNDANQTDYLSTLSDTERDIVLHIVAAHHGRARPYFPHDEIFDYSSSLATPDTAIALATEIPRRFARLQKRYGRWGLAWLESLLRAADYAASMGIVAKSDTATSVYTPRSPSTEVEPTTTSTITLSVNPVNPGHYFACCGLFELASRLTPVLAWFEQDSNTRQWCFHLANTPPLADLLTKISTAEITTADKSEEEEDIEEEKSEGDEKDASAPPLLFGSPFNLRLDWWTTASVKTSALKVWAGSMKVHNIARSMSFAIQQSLYNSVCANENIFTNFQITYDLSKIEKRKSKIEQAYEAARKRAEEKRVKTLEKAEAEKSGGNLEKEKTKIIRKFEDDVAQAEKNREQDLASITTKAEKIEPFYFDANRGPNAHSRDVGFAVNDLKLKTLASPAVELLTLVGLQRATPVPAPDAPRNFDYRLWTCPLPISLLPAAVNGLLPDNSPDIFRFESWFRTGQRKHKAFLTARIVPPVNFHHQHQPSTNIQL